MSGKMTLLCEKITGEKSLQEFLNKSGFDFNGELDSIVCRSCGFVTRATLSTTHIEFMHKLLKPKCELVRHIKDKYENYALYNVIFYINNYKSAITNILDIEKIMKSSFCWWPKRLPQVNKLVSAGFFYTGTEDDVMCIECHVVLHHWEADDDPWFEHEKASPDCLLVRLYKL